jgi:hypothetical protein
MDEPRATQTHKTHHNPNLGEATTFPPYNIFCTWPRGQHPNVIFSWDSQVGVLKFPKLGFPRFCKPTTSSTNLWLRWGLKQSCSLCQDLFNIMLHAICMQGNQGDSRPLVVGRQIANLTPNLSFGYNLCFQNPNGSWEPILNIYIPRTFQWYKELFNKMSFDPCNCLLKI